MIETLIGSLLGGAFRLVPEVMKQIDRKDERKHELSLLNLQIEADKMRGDMNIAQMEAGLGSKEIDAIIEATKAQAIPTGIGWVDALSSTVRPFVTYIILFLYGSHKILILFTALDSGVPVLQAASTLWGQEDMALMSSILSFWFVDRSLRKIGKPNAA